MVWSVQAQMAQKFEDGLVYKPTRYIQILKSQKKSEKLVMNRGFRDSTPFSNSASLSTSCIISFPLFQRYFACFTTLIEGSAIHSASILQFTVCCYKFDVIVWRMMTDFVLRRVSVFHFPVFISNFEGVKPVIYSVLNLWNLI